MELNSNEIQKIIPYRYLFLLVDKITDFAPGEWAQGIKCVSANEHFFADTFLIITLCLQSWLSKHWHKRARYITCKGKNKGKLIFFAGIKNARFRRQVRPGDVLELSCVLKKQKGAFGIGEAVAKVNGETAVTAKLSFAIGGTG